jgi:hypothetical protein
MYHSGGHRGYPGRFFEENFRALALLHDIYIAVVSDHNGECFDDVLYATHSFSNCQKIRLYGADCNQSSLVVSYRVGF